MKTMDKPRNDSEGEMMQCQLDGDRYTEEQAAWSEVLGLVNRLGRWEVADWLMASSDDAREGFGILRLEADASHSPQMEALAKFLGATYLRGRPIDGDGLPVDEPFMWWEWKSEYETQPSRSWRDDESRMPALFELRLTDIFEVRDMLRVWADYQWAVAQASQHSRAS